MRTLFFCFILALAASSAGAQTWHPRLLDSGTVSPFPLVVANDNRTPAGQFVDGVLNLDLEVLWSDWRIETDDRPGLLVAAIAESGGPPMVPGPLLRVDEGTPIRVRIHNTLVDSSLTVYGLQSHPSSEPDSIFVAPGETVVTTFNAGEPGTYFYWIKLGVGISSEIAEREQLAGAFVVDPKGGSPPDRILVMNIFSEPNQAEILGRDFLEALTINGKSWPFTERMRPAVGDTVRWRVVNASNREHPMHLHGFFYDVLAIGSPTSQQTYAREDRRTVVTEQMPPRTTMQMEWVPRREGNWLFHCHLSFHVAGDLRLPDPSEQTDEHAGHGMQDMRHMAGLVVGIEVQPGPTDIVSHGDDRHLDLYVNEYPDDTLNTYAFSLEPGFYPDSTHRATPGPVLFLKQYQTTWVTVKNNMSIPTGIHWHGLELDSWSDGVPDWSRSDGRVSPVIPAGEEFTYKLSLMRPGTFIYHSHLDDVHQLTGGLYGAIIVLGEGETFDPERDYLGVFGWRDPDPKVRKDVELNGRDAQPSRTGKVGEEYRIRVVHIAPAGTINTWMTKDDAPVPLLTIAKDGADLPTHQQKLVEVSAPMGVGETADFQFAPTEPGTYRLNIGYPGYPWITEWVVSE